MVLCPGLPGWACTTKVKPIWILLKQETVSGSGISWAICKSAPRSRQTTTPAPQHSVFYTPDALPAAQPTVQSTEAKKKLFVKYSEIYCHFVSVGKRQNSALCTLLNLNHEWIPGHSRTKIIFHDFSGPWKFRKKFQDFPGGARNLRYVVVVRNSISLLTFYHTNIYTHAYIHSWLQRLNHFACFPWEGKASPFPESYQQTHSNRSAISFLHQLSTWHCSHLLLSVVLWPRAAAPLLLGTWRSISHAHTVVSSKPAACHGCGQTTG